MNLSHNGNYEERLVLRTTEAKIAKRVFWAAAVVLVAMVFVAYYPGLRMGFYLDDYIYLERAGRTDWSNALAQIFDPRLQNLWYRPLQAVQFFLEFQIFGGNANAYHLVNMTFHAINVLWLYALAWRISGRWLLGLAAALFYATFPVYASGINWIGIVDPLNTVFYLAAVWFWWEYLEREQRRHYALAFGAFVLALMSKQVSVTLPVVLFLVEWCLKRRPFSLARAVRRYALFVAGALAFTLIQYGTQSTHTFAGVFGWQVGAAMGWMLWQYIALFFFPWGVFPSIDLNLVDAGDVRTFAWAALALLLLFYALWRTRSRVLLFLGAFALLNLVPVLPFPFIEHRYLYLPILSAALLFALIGFKARARWGGQVWFAAAASLFFVILSLGNGLAVDASVAEAAEWARQLRVPFRDIERQHATYPPDTLLYFIDPITPTTGGLSGMFFLRYGRGMTVRNWTEYAGLSEHNAAYIYYFDETRRPQEIRVQGDAVPGISPPLPVRFNAPIVFDGYEVPRTAVPRGSPLVLILYWHATGPIDRNYTLFVHLLDKDGRIAAQYDGEPRKGQNPTTEWRPYLLAADSIVLPISPAAPIGEGFKVELGLYDAETQQRLVWAGADGQVSASVITIGPFSIAP